MSPVLCLPAHSINQKVIFVDPGFRSKSGERGIPSNPWREFRPWLALVLLLATSMGWTVDYPIVYDANGGTGTIANGVKTQGVNATLSDGTGFTRPGYRVAGWEITPKGCVAAWGYNGDGQTTIPSGLTGVKAIAAGDYNTVALKQDGTVVEWGRSLPWKPAELTGVTAIAAGSDHIVALKQDGTVVAWGWNYVGQTTIPSGLAGVTAIAAANSHTVALKQDGTVVAWGNNSEGQTTVPSDLTGVTAIAAGHYHTVALKRDGTVVAWGSNGCGQTKIPSGLTGVTAIAAGEFHSLALRQNGTVVAWGDSSLGQATIPGGLTGVMAIAAGGRFSLALMQDGTVVGWGDNSYNQRIDSRIMMLPPIATFAAGRCHSVAFGPSYEPGGTYTINRPVTLYARWSVDLISQFVTRFYEYCLGRAPDAGGLSSLTTALRTKTQSGADFARSVVLNQECINRNLSNDAFLNVLYTTCFNRAPDAGGLAMWQGELAKGVLREDVLYGFINAHEFTNLCTGIGIAPNSAAGQQRYQVRQFVRRNYQQYLGREPDAVGINGWIDALVNGTQTGGDVTKGFGTSQEFLNKNTDNSTFLDLTYKAFFDRAADAGGKAGWMTYLSEGHTRAEVLDGFIKAQEFINLCARYNILPFRMNG